MNTYYELGVKLALEKIGMTPEELDPYASYPMKGLGIGAGAGAGLGTIIGGVLSRKAGIGPMLGSAGLGALAGGAGGAMLGGLAPLLSDKVRAARRASSAGVDSMIHEMSSPENADRVIDDDTIQFMNEAYNRAYREALTREAAQYRK